jgi:hypothetical protein
MFSDQKILVLTPVPIQVFGVPPPQTLYTRPSASLPPSFTTAPPSGISEVVQTEPSSPVGRSRNPNQASYKGKRRHDRPGTSESTEPLLPSRGSESFSVDFQTPSSLAIPDVYTHYQHSLHSLNDIIDRVIFSVLSHLMIGSYSACIGRSCISGRTSSVSAG